MSLFLAQTDGTTNFEFTLSEQHIVSISVMDTGVGFDEANPVALEGTTCVEVTYARTETGPTAVRLDDLVHDNGFVNPEEIIAHGVDGSFVIAGFPITSIAGIALPLGDASSPYTNHIATFYDTSQCNGSGYWVDKDGGGTTSFASDVILYHELAHCFHFATGVSSTEPLAEADENDMRDVKGTSHRDTASHTGGCGGGPENCCIVASLTTDSPYSEEIKRFRHFREHTLRSSEAGEEFFNEFFYRYYAFSPEVTSLIGHQPNLRPVIKENFVLPLLSGVELLIRYTDNKGVGLAEFLRYQSAREGLSGIYRKDFLNELSDYSKIARNFDNETISRILKGKGEKYAGFKKLLKHINKETIRDEYIDWSLIAVIELWVESAQLLYSGKTETEIDSEVYEKIVRWIALMPVSNVWNDFSRLETELELQSLEQFMYDPRSKEIFSRRLIEKHPQYSETILGWAQGERRGI